MVSLLPDATPGFLLELKYVKSHLPHRGTNTLHSNSTDRINYI